MASGCVTFRVSVVTVGCLIKKLLLGHTDLLEGLAKEKGSVRKAKRRVEYCLMIRCKGEHFIKQGFTTRNIRMLTDGVTVVLKSSVVRGELSYLAPLGSENFSAPYFKQCFQTGSNTTPPSPKTEITNILFYILNFASIIKFKM